ncbi:Peroxisomal targeting signal receptor [Phlyctema vagabunda]|uniref:Peroxisomal targeting signal receptor n=1 Tax=Phlyctema vagabunda TaxID=108571 RepID=A0ABR4P5L9_9HELO
MALCSSSRNPVGLFSKHIQNDRSLHTDRLVFKQSTNREGIREAGYRRGQFTDDDFGQFNDRQGCQPRFEQQQMILGLDVQSSPQTTTKGYSIRNGWVSEYSKTGNGSTESLMSYTQGQNYGESTKDGTRIQTRRTTYKQKAGGQPGLVFPAPHKYSQYGRHEGYGINRIVAPLRIKETIAQPEIRDIDWEAAFSQLEQVNQMSKLSTSEELEQEQHTSSEPSWKECSSAESSQSTVSGEKTKYTYCEENPFHSSHDPFIEGMEIVQKHGNLTFAALAFEAATVRDPAKLEAWKMLGTVLADNEQEGKAILAFKKALELNSDESVIPLRLAICYTNEGQPHAACDSLEEWLWSRYPQVTPSTKVTETKLSQRYTHLKDLYIRAAQLCPTGENMDPNVQVALGILFFSTREYEQAADCFAAAIAFTSSMDRETDQLHLLHNHYGACVGNMSRHDEAISAYQQALELKPNYSRAHYNLGAAYLGQGNPRAGAQTLVQRLHADMMHIVPVGTSHGRLQEMRATKEGDDEVTHDVHEALRRCCYAISRDDLAEQVRPGMDLRAFERELDF